jgi:replicative DNA helicase
MNRINGTDSPTSEECRAIADALAAMNTWKLYVIDEGCSTLSDIERMLARAKLSGDPIRLLCIDHFGLIQPDKRGKSRYEEYTEISNRVKVIAKKYKVTILCLCQMNRVKDSFSRPSMEDLRDTGSLEQDADKILFLNRVKDSPDLTEITLAKNRQGALAECRMRFIGSLMRFTRA